MKNYSRRKFIKKSGLSAIASLGGSTLLNNSCDGNLESTSRKGKYMGDFKAPKINTIQVAFIGVGARGTGHAKHIAKIEGTEIVAISDLYEDLVNRSVKNCIDIGNGRHKNIKRYFGGESEWKKMLDEVKPDIVFISTNWKNHAPMAIEVMNKGAHAFVEVPIAVTIEEMWQIVDTSEQTQKHCMMMENVNYGREELLYLNLCRQNIIGDLLHGEAAYIHELRFQMKEEDRGTGSWRTHHYANRNGNLYPTHGLGPVAQYMNLSRGEDQFNSIVSFSSPSKGRNLYSKNNYSKDHKWNALDFKGGDLNTSILKSQLGRTIMIQWDETSPRPYSRHNLIQGTKGILAGFPARIALEGGVPGITKDHHRWAEGDRLDEFIEKYDHPMYKRLGSLAKKMGGHGGMDFMMLYRIIECLRNGQALDQNVYEGCFWSAVAPLSEASVAQKGLPQKFPDFTRENWKITKPLGIIS